MKKRRSHAPLHSAEFATARNQRAFRDLTAPLVRHASGYSCSRDLPARHSPPSCRCSLPTMLMTSSAGASLAAE